MSNELADNKYLGLQSLVGRSKNRVFGFIKDKVWRRIQSWKVNPLSTVGKLVLIKNMAQSIPAYCTSCFLLSKSLYQDIERMLNNFWWRSNVNDGKVIKWHSWEGKSMSKSKGGLGFRSLHDFNISLGKTLLDIYELTSVSGLSCVQGELLSELTYSKSFHRLRIELYMVSASHNKKNSIFGV